MLTERTDRAWFSRLYDISHKMKRVYSYNLWGCMGYLVWLVSVITRLASAQYSAIGSHWSLTSADWPAMVSDSPLEWRLHMCVALRDTPWLREASNALRARCVRSPSRSPAPCSHFFMPAWTCESVDCDVNGLRLYGGPFLPQQTPDSWHKPPNHDTTLNSRHKLPNFTTQTPTSRHKPENCTAFPPVSTSTRSVKIHQEMDSSCSEWSGTFFCRMVMQTFACLQSQLCALHSHTV